MKLIKLGAEWCGQCKALTKTLDSMGINYDNIDMDTELGEEFADKYKVRSLPTLVAIGDNDEFLGKLPGNPSIDVIKSFIKEHETH